MASLGYISRRLIEEGFKEARDGILVTFYVNYDYTKSIMRELDFKKNVFYSVVNTPEKEDICALVATATIDKKTLVCLESHLKNIALQEPTEKWTEEAFLLRDIIFDFLNQNSQSTQKPNSTAQ